MANYGGHSKWGKIGAGLAFLVVLAALATRVDDLRWVFGLAGLAGGLVFIFSTFPDTDHPDAIPRRQLVKLGQFGVVVGGIWVAYSQLHQVTEYIHVLLVSLSPDIPASFATGGVVLALIAVGVLSVPVIIDRLTGSHRTRTHSWKTAIAIAGFMALLAGVTTGRLFDAIPVTLEQIGLIVACAVIFGFAIHFKLDGILLGK